MIVSDSSPLIFLSKINSLFLLEKTYKKIIIPEEVKEEIFFKNEQENHIIKNLISKNLIEQRKIEKPLSLNIGRGETAAISLALELKLPLLIDEAPGTKIAKSLGIKTIRTTLLIFSSPNKKIINKNEAIDLINKLIEKGYYISPRH